MSNHEERPRAETVDLLLAFSRKKDGQSNKKCIRVVIKDFALDLALLESRLKILGGEWRIHATVNKRDVKKAKKWFLHKLIDTDIFDGCLDSLWRTALLQKENAAEHYFLLDIDTKNSRQAFELSNKIAIHIEKWIKTPNGFHFITKPFDTREICKLPYVTLIRDGYYFIKKVGK
jgi:hypothetical protein